MSRPAALAGRDAPTPEAPSVAVARIRADRHFDVARALALFDAEPAREMYSVEVAAALGCRVVYAAGLLHQLHDDGLLTSRITSSPISWKRRYYKRAVT